MREFGVEELRSSCMKTEKGFEFRLYKNDKEVYYTELEEEPYFKVSAFFNEECSTCAHSKVRDGEYWECIRQHYEDNCYEEMSK